jgi:4-hydroxy-2-oxoheptanedioate aldolase
MAEAASLRAKWDAGEPAFGMWAGIDSSLAAELAAAAGYDYVCVDLQHGMSDERAMVAMFQATMAGGAIPMARIAWTEPWMIMRALDLGARGVIVPLVGSGDEALRAVRACKYPPHGDRSYGPVRAGLIVGSSPTELAASAMCFAMIETRDGLDRLDEIASTPGLDGIYIGPSDLALALGHMPGEGGDELEDAIGRVRRACEAHGLISGMHCRAGAAARGRVQEGFKLVTVGVDTQLLRATFTRELAEAYNSDA